MPPRRAVLAGAVETAVNALWDVPPLLGDRVSVVGAGMIGCAAARLVAGVPGAAVTLVDADPSRAAAADALGVRFALPDEMVVYTGHGDSTTIGTERPHLDEWIARGH